MSPISTPDLYKLSRRSAFNALHIPEQLIHSALPGVARQLVVPQGFSLSMTGVSAILLEHRPDPGSAAIWLFIVGAAPGLRDHGPRQRRASVRQRAPAGVGYQLFNLSPVVVVPAVSLIVWWIPLVPVAYALGGLSTSCGYLLAVASIFHAIRTAPR